MTADDALALTEPSICKLASIYARGNLQNYEDLCQEGRLAVVAALPRMDCAKYHTKPITYLLVAAKGAMRHWMRDYRQAIRFPGYLSERGGKGPPLDSYDAMPEPEQVLPAAKDNVEEEVLMAVATHPEWDNCKSCAFQADGRVCPISENRRRLLASNDGGVFVRRLGDLVEVARRKLLCARQQMEVLS